jgi:hypothetical protein
MLRLGQFLGRGITFWQIYFQQAQKIWGAENRFAMFIGTY